jgi:hypothetical protein
LKKPEKKERKSAASLVRRGAEERVVEQKGGENRGKRSSHDGIFGQRSASKV